MRTAAVSAFTHLQDEPLRHFVHTTRWIFDRGGCTGGVAASVTVAGAEAIRQDKGKDGSGDSPPPTCK